MIKIAFPAFLAIFSGFCFSQIPPGPKSSSSTPASAAKSKAKPAEAKSDEEAIPPVAPNAIFPAVVAMANGKPIFGRDLEIAIRQELATIGSPEWKDLREEYKGQLTQTKLFSLVNTNLIYQKAVESGVKATDAEVQAELQKMSKAFKDNAEMDAELAKKMMNRALLERNVLQSLTVSKYMEENIDKKSKMSPQEVAKFYADNPERFDHPNLVRLSLLLIAAGETRDKDALAKKRAEELLARVGKGEDFAKLAKENSADQSAAQGGDIHYRSKNGLDPQYADAAFSLPVGSVKMVKLSDGYLIFKVTDKKKEGKWTLEEVKQNFTEELDKLKSQTESTKLINRLRDQGNVEFLIPYGQPLEP
jgi:parvulin-like peptidyl-prolyl isomerase